MTSPSFKELLDFYRHLSPSTLPQLARFYDSEACFKDPFNEVQGLAAIEKIFQHMFAALEQPRFKIIRALANDPEGHTSAFVTWVFEFSRAGQDFAIRGVTEFDFNPQGQITRHRDYWDAAEELYAKLPLLGWPVRWLAKQLSSVK
jgi:hypothetical protein